MNGVRYVLLDIRAEVLRALKTDIDFEGLVRDRHTSSLRSRRFSRFRAEGQTVDLLPHIGFSQADSFGFERVDDRRFEPLVAHDAPAGRWYAIRHLVIALNQVLGLPQAEVGVHAIRTEVGSDNLGEPSPEGLHQDGFAYVAIIAITAPPSGAITRLVSVAEARTLEVGTLQPGQALVFDDQRFLHYTENFGRWPHRDVVVLTFSPSEPFAGIHDIVRVQC